MPRDPPPRPHLRHQQDEPPLQGAAGLKGATLRFGGIAALFKDYRQYAGARLSRALALVLIGAVAEGFGLLMIVPLASIAIGDRSAELSRFAPWASAWSPDQRFGVALALFLAAMAVRSVVLYLRDVETAQLVAGYEASLRLRSAATLARRGWPFASKIGRPGMQSLLLVDVPRASLAITYLQQLAISAVMVAVPLMLTALLSPALTIVAIGVLGLGAVASRRWIRRGAESGIAISETAERGVSSGFHFHAGLKAALAQGTVGPFLEEYRASLANVTGQAVRLNRDYAAARQMSALGAAAAAALLLFVGVRLLALPFPVLIASLVLFARVSNPALVLLRAAQQIAAYTPSFTAIERRLGGLEPDVRTELRGEPLDWSELRLDRVAFEHRPELGLTPTSLTLRSGEWLGLTGPSGAGKTTLVDLVGGLLTPEDGAITVDGRPLAGDILDRWHAALAYVGQETTIFTDSVRANLLAEGTPADDDELWRALETVGLADRIRQLPGTLDESVGGSQLSGGEQQRLVLARALLRRPSLLILDEATAALDRDSEAALVRALKSAEPRPAAIVVAHRDSTLTHCDSVVSLQHRPIGTAVSPGSPA